MKYFYKLLIVSVVFFSASGYCGNLIRNATDHRAAHSVPAIKPIVPKESDSTTATENTTSLVHPCPSSFSGKHEQLTNPEGTKIPRLFPQWVMGYYVGNQVDNYPINVIDWSALTHIIFASVRVNSDGTLNLDFDDAAHGKQNAIKLAAAAHANCVKALLMLGGGDGYSDGLMDATNTDTKLAEFVKKLLAAMDNLGYDGIDLDWEEKKIEWVEGKTPEEIEKINEERLQQSYKQLTNLTNALRAARGNRIILTYPAFPINPNFQTVNTQLVKLAESLDRFNVQTYFPAVAQTNQDWNSWFVAPLDGATLPHTPISVKSSLDLYADAGIPKWKLGMGTAFYAVCYTKGNTEITGPYQDTTGSEIKGGDNNFPLSQFYASNGVYSQAAKFERKLDSKTSEPYLTASVPQDVPQCNASTQYISYENEDSLIAKGKFSKSNSYGGIIIWTLQQGWLPSDATEGRKPEALMQALKEGFLNP